MGLGVLDDGSKLDHVPGTVILAERHERPIDDGGLLKRGTGRHSDIILTPQPSDDPNDPLNWSFCTKLTVMLVLVLGASLNAATTGPLLNASLVVLAMSFDRPLVDITLLSGYHILMAGVTCPLVAALSRKYGKRPVFLFSSLMCLIGSIIGSTSQTYDTLLAGRIVQGAGVAAYESLTFSVVGDIFFVHERGFWTSVISFTLTCVSNLSSVVAGSVTLHLGWHYLFHLMVVAVGFQTICCIFLVPETCYNRDPRFIQHLVVNKVDTSTTEENGEPKEACISTVEGANMEPTMPPPPKKTLFQRMAVFTGVYSDESLLKLVFSPFICCLNLAAFWTIIITGAVTSFYVAIAYIIAQIFYPPPYLLTTAQIGYLSLGPFIGGTIGSVAVALMMDRLAIWMAERNNGVYEPEFRLVTVPLGVLCVGGLFGFGAISQSLGDVYLIDFMWGLILCGVAFICAPCSAYAIDAFRGMSTEIFVANVMVKNFLFFGYSYFMNDWVATVGTATPFYTFGAVCAGLLVTTIFAYVFGKRYRSFWYRHNIMEKLNIKTHAEW